MNVSGNGVGCDCKHNKARGALQRLHSLEREGARQDSGAAAWVGGGRGGGEDRGRAVGIRVRVQRAQLFSGAPRGRLSIPLLYIKFSERRRAGRVGGGGRETGESRAPEGGEPTAFGATTNCDL